MNPRRTRPTFRKAFFLTFTALTLAVMSVAAFVRATPADSTDPRTRLTDFTDPDHNARWRMVNDNVMGGRSLGDVAFDAERGVMTFSGSINTDGGGFSSVRLPLPLPPGALADATHIALRVRPDGRTPYRFQVIDDRPVRRSRVIHRYDLPLGPDDADAWHVVSVPLDGMTPSLRGDPVDAPPLDPGRAVQIGFILNDTGDGPFRLDIDWIDAVTD